MSKILPNLLIVGAAKSGTSSLHKYLQQHPQIFMSEHKEPRYFSSQASRLPLNGPKDDQVESWYVKEYEDYLKLFENAEGYKVVGESSADTLYFFKGTIPLIKKHLGDPKIIISLRNPVKRAFSAYQHMVRDLREDLSFEDGLKEEPNRIRNNWELIYHYTAVSMYYESVKAFMDNFTNVKVVLNEDQAKRPQHVLRDLFRFLDVNPHVDINTDIRYNVSGKPKSQWLHQFLSEENMARKLAQPIVRTFLSSETRLRLAQKIYAGNLTRLTMNHETKVRLQALFEDDIRKLEKLLQRNLSIWRK